MIDDQTHNDILRKFDYLKGKELHGRVPIKGENTENRVPADDFVKVDHILHDLIRGFYKPKGKPYILSYQATESDKNYGRQIFWRNQSKGEFKYIKMHPPSSLKDNRRKSDIAAARYNMEHRIPFGIIYKVKKGINLVLGLGEIIHEDEKGIFLVKPCTLKELASPGNERTIPSSVINNLGGNTTELLQEIKKRKGQEKFRQLLLLGYENCALCDIKAVHSKASHIKPWRYCDDQERLDFNNGLLLCPNHDYLFDQGLISFDSQGKIVVSPFFTKREQSNFVINQNMKIYMSDKMALYMDYHLKNQFKGG